jgi:hypothetical protein
MEKSDGHVYTARVCSLFRFASPRTIAGHFLCFVQLSHLYSYVSKKNGKELHQSGLRLANNVGMLAEQVTDDLVRQDD